MALPPPKRALGQNFLVDRSVLARIASLVATGPGECLLEVGPGRGALTDLLAATGARLVAVELDRQLVPYLTERFASFPTVEVVAADIMRVDLPKLLGERCAGPWKVAANLPYNISSQVLLLFVENRRLFSRLVLMLQKEVGERLAAPPDCKEYGVLTVFCQLHFEVRKEFTVRPGAFFPAPKVDSVVLSVVPRSRPLADVGDEALFRRVVKAAFGQRRKTLWNCLKGATFGLPDEALRQLLSECAIEPVRRGETLSIEEFALLTRRLAEVLPPAAG